MRRIFRTLCLALAACLALGRFPARGQDPELSDQPTRATLLVGASAHPYLLSLDRLERLVGAERGMSVARMEPRFSAPPDYGRERLVSAVQVSLFVQLLDLMRTSSRGVGTVTGWSPPSPGNLLAAWTEPPVLDRDDWSTNYVGHPLAGSVYYKIMRNRGAGMRESFLFSSAMSALAWEGFWEAWFERPSVQDLFVTPVLGSFVIGEPTFRLKRYVEERDAEHPAWWKKGIIVILDPVDHLERNMGIGAFQRVEPQVQRERSLLDR